METHFCTFQGCKRSFTDASSRRKHAAVHTGDMPYRCHQCMKAFSNAIEVDAHISTFHSTEKAATSSGLELGQDLFKCPFCALSCRSISEVDHHITCRHRQEQYGEKKAKRSCTDELRCTFQGCNRLFEWPHHLQYHIKTHEGDKAYKCAIGDCHKAFYTSQQRAVHMKSHTGERNYCCKIDGCSKKFVTNQQLTNHLRIHTGEKPFKCSFTGCDKAFAEYSSLKKHTVTHTGEKPYSCQNCERSFSQSSTLHTHIRRHHLPGNDNTNEKSQTKGERVKSKSSRKPRKKAIIKELSEEYLAPVESKEADIAISNSSKIMAQTTLENTATVISNTDLAAPVLSEPVVNDFSTSVIVLPQPSGSSVIPSYYDENDIYFERVHEIQVPEHDFNLYTEINNVGAQNSTEDKQVVVD